MYIISVFCFVAWPKPMQTVGELSRDGLVGLGLVPIGPFTWAQSVCAMKWARNARGT